MRYLRPHDLADAVAHVAAGAVPIAGGSVVVPRVARGEAEPTTIVDVGHLEPLRRLDADGDELVIGAAVTLDRLAGLDGEGEAALREAAAGIANPLVRRLGTVGGNVASGLDQADLVPALLVLGAEAVWLGPGGEEREPVAASLGRGGDWLLTAVRIRRDPGRRSGFAKFAWRRATGTAVASVALAARADNGVIRDPRVGAGGFLPPAQLEKAEGLLDGKPWNDDAVAEAAAVAALEAAERAGLAANDLRPRLVGVGVRRLVARLGAQ
jgi:aerobic carbon-monoxide dehydrogenase medium subunit